MSDQAKGTAYCLIKHGIEDRDWRKIEEAAELLNIYFFKKHTKPSKPNKTKEELDVAMRVNPEAYSENIPKW